MWNQVQETVNFIKEKTNFSPEYGVILGSGLGSFTDDIQIEFSLSYSDIPNFPVSTVQGHKGALVFGTIGQKKVVAMQGRFHFYEGYIALITDHINLMPEHPLRGINDERFGPRFVNMSEPYSRKMIEKAKDLAKKLHIEVKEGVYLGLQGPTFETLSEYRMVKILSADCVGMSTVPEVIVARHMDLEVFGISVITDIGNEDSIGTITHAEVLEAAQKAEPNVRNLIKELILNY